MYFLRRILYAIPLLLVISALAFGLVHLAPGGPFDAERQPASPEVERNLNAKYHLDEPVWKQYGRYLGNLVQGDFGVSLKYRDHTVNDIIAQGLPVSVALGGLAFCFAIGVGIPLGFFTAARRGNWVGYNGGFLAVLAVCVPGVDPCPGDEIEMVSVRIVDHAVAHGVAGRRAGHLFRRADRADHARGDVECGAV
jgi:oligopeptide transport system permease protein